MSGRVGKYERDEIGILEGYIKMCRSHQNQSNWYVIENQIESIKLRIIYIKDIRDKQLKCESCDKPCGESWCSTNKTV